MECTKEEAWRVSALAADKLAGARVQGSKPTTYVVAAQQWFWNATYTPGNS